MKIQCLLVEMLQHHISLEHCKREENCIACYNTLLQAPITLFTKILKEKTRQTIQQILGSVRAATYQYSLCGSSKTNAKLCEVLKEYFGKEKKA